MEAGRGQLIDIDTGELRSAALLVQRGPGAIVLIGIGEQSMQLQRFACGDRTDASPFIARCQEAAEAIETGCMQKAAAFDIPEPVLAIEDSMMRRLAIAEALAKAGFDPDEPRVPAGNPDGGQWAGGESEAAIEPAAARGDDIRTRKERFVGAHIADAQKAADELGVPVENILGLSALESQWGESRFALQANNFLEYIIQLHLRVDIFLPGMDS